MSQSRAISCRSVRTRATALALLALGASPLATAAVFTVGGPVGPGLCTHPTLQAAIDAAAASPGLDIIRLTRGEHVAQRLVINDSSTLSIEGGFLECATLVRVDQSTLSGTGANPPGPVVRHLGSGNLVLANLHIRNGAAYGSSATTTAGGGIASTGSGALTVHRSLIYNNRARNGGGIHASVPTLPAKEVTLEGVRFIDNEAESSGGGLHVQRASVTITGAEVNYFGGNRALGNTVTEGGGAIHAASSSVFIHGRVSPAFPFMDGNWTNANGGAIHFAVSEAGWHSLSMRNIEAATPLQIAASSASRFGGAIYLRASAPGLETTAAANLQNVIVTDNRAADGSAFYVFGSSTGAIGRATLSLLSSLPGWAAPPCPAVLRCNRVDRNVGAAGGATITTEQGGNSGQASFLMQRGHLVDNFSPNGGSLLFASGAIDIDNSVIASNDTGNTPLIDNAGGHLTRVQNSTIAGNLRTTPAVFKLAQATDTLILHNSIAFQPGVPVVQAPVGSVIDARNLLVGNGHGLADAIARNLQETLDPMFAGAAQGDFRPRLGSPAVNRWSPGGGVAVPTIDLLGALRPAPVDAPTPYDFGAYEFGAVVDPIFNDTVDRN